MWPPTKPPGLLSTRWGGFLIPARFEKKLFASNLETILYSYHPPCVSFEPLLSITFTEAPPASPCSESLALVATLTFWMASMEGTMACALVFQGFRALIPSMRTAAPAVPVPLNANVMDLEGLLGQPASWPAGGAVPGSSPRKP